MRELTYNEINTISGGINSNGYTFSYLVGNIAGGMIIGIPIAIITGQPNMIGTIGALFGLYAAAMITANVLDQTIFSDQSTPKVEEVVVISQG